MPEGVMLFYFIAGWLLVETQATAERLGFSQ